MVFYNISFRSASRILQSNKVKNISRASYSRGHLFIVCKGTTPQAWHDRTVDDRIEQDQADLGPHTFPSAVILNVWTLILARDVMFVKLQTGWECS